MIVDEPLEVEKIVSHRFSGNSVEYHIRLKGFEKLEWVSENYFHLNVSEKLESYKKENNLTLDNLNGTAVDRRKHINSGLSKCTNEKINVKVSKSKTISKPPFNKLLSEPGPVVESPKIRSNINIDENLKISSSPLRDIFTTSLVSKAAKRSIENMPLNNITSNTTGPLAKHLYSIVANNEVHTLYDLLQSKRRNIVCQIVRDNPILLVMSVTNNSLEMFNMLLDFTNDVNGTNSSGSTALMAACENGNQAMAEILIKRGADVNIMINGRNILLETCIKNNNVRMLKLILNSRPDVASIEDLITDKSSSISTILEEYKAQIEEPLDIRTRKWSDTRFYLSIVKQISCNSGLKLCYQDQTKIPSALKLNTETRKMVLFSCTTPRLYTIEQIMEEPLTGAFDIHVAQSEGQLIADHNGNRIVTNVNQHHTYIVNKKDASLWRFSLRPIRDPGECAFICALELYRNNALEEVRKDGQGFVYNRNEEEYKQRLSFTKADLPPSMTKQKLLFLYATLRETINDTLTPVQVTILTYESKVLFDKMICPRSRLRKTSIKGCDEFLGQLDEVVAKNAIAKITDGKILVGFNVRPVIECLGLKEDSICGIRDMSNAEVIRKRTKDPNESMVIHDVAKDMSIEKPLNSSRNIAFVILLIYKIVEEEWEDTLRTPLKVDAGLISISTSESESLVEKKLNENNDDETSGPFVCTPDTRMMEMI